MNDYFNNVSLLRIILKRKFPLLIIIATAILVSVIFSGTPFIEPKYKSYAVIYPSNLVPYSSETPTEQMLQIFNSEDIVSTIISKFDLINHYEVDSSNQYYQTVLRRKYNSNVKIRRSEFESVIIEVYDINPDTACHMVEAIVGAFNQKNRIMHREKKQEEVVVWKNLMSLKKQVMDSLVSRMDTIRAKYQILDYTQQVKAVSKQEYKSSTPQTKAMMANLEEMGGEFKQLESYLSSVTYAYNAAQVEYEKALSDLNKELTYTNLVTRPLPADRKSYPIRWLIVTLSTLSAFVFSLMIFVAIERLNTVVDNKNS